MKQSWIFRIIQSSAEVALDFHIFRHFEKKPSKKLLKKKIVNTGKFSLNVISGHMIVQKSFLYADLLSMLETVLLLNIFWDLW